MIDTFEISAKNLSNLVVDETQEKFQMILMKVASGKLINLNFTSCKLLQRFGEYWFIQFEEYGRYFGPLFVFV